MNIEEQYTRNGLKVELIYDDSAESPREWDNLGTMICAHRGYDLGDEQANFSDYHSWEHIKQELLIEEREAVIILPLGLHEHSSITMYVGENHDKWDGGQVGFIYCDQKAVDQYGGTDEENLKNAEACLRSEVETYDLYLRGETYGYRITDPVSDEEIDSCWGYLGLDHVTEAANESADSYEHPVREAIHYSAFKELFKELGVNPLEFKNLSGDRVMGHFPDMNERKPKIIVANLAKVLWGASDEK